VNLLAVTCYTGGEELCHMTDHCLRSLQDCVPKGVEMVVAVTAQGAEMNTLTEMSATYIHLAPENVGFAYGMNRAIQMSVRCESEAPDWVLCFNNDLLFPQKDWLRNLLEIAVHPTDQILVPATDSAAIRVQPGLRNKNSFPVQEMSAYCWLVPFAWCQWLKKTHGFWLFSEDFGVAYGEDNWTSFLFSKQFGPKVFRYVPRSFVKHLRARTSSIVKPDRKRSNRVLVDKLNKELSDPGLRSDLRQWARGLVRILSQRL
jgi:hypothetical protein